MLWRSALLCHFLPRCWVSLERNQFERAEQVWVLVLQHTRTTPVQLLQQQRQGYQSSVSPLFLFVFFVSDDALSFHKLTSCVLTVTLRSIVQFTQTHFMMKAFIWTKAAIKKNKKTGSLLLEWIKPTQEHNKNNTLYPLPMCTYSVLAP